LSVTHSDVLKPETNTTDLLTSAEHNAAPPLVSIATPSAVQRPWEEDQPVDISPPFTFEQHRGAGPEAGVDLSTRGFGRSAKLITGTAIIIVAFGGISYFLFASESSRSSPPQNTALINHSEPAAPIPSITSVPPSDTPSSRTATPPPSSPPESQTTPLPATVRPEPSAHSLPTSWPDPPSPVQESAKRSPIGPRDRTALSRLTTDSAVVRQPAPRPQSSQFVFLQRPGVNVRSTPSLTGSVIASLPKGTRFQVLEHGGDWVQVKSGSSKGWVNARFIGPNAP